MSPLKLLQMACIGFAFAWPSLAIAQGKKKSNPRQQGAAAAIEWFGGDAERWLQALLDSEEIADSYIYVDRLSYFRLNASQLDQLRTATDDETSDKKRVVLWQALRQTRDTRTREHLIKTLVEKNSADMQIQFLDALKNPTRFDVPILVALYNSHSPRKKKGAHADPPFESRNAKKNSGYLRLEEDSNQAAEKGLKRAAQRFFDEKELGAEYASLFNVPLKVVELACHNEWANFTHMTGWEYPGENDAKEMPWLDARSQRSAEAVLAREELLYWLLKNGFEDTHRLSAFETFTFRMSTWYPRKEYANLGRELLTGLEDPDSLAKAVPLVAKWIEPTRFLAPNYAEGVRLSALETMERQVNEAFRNPLSLYFWDKIAVYKPIMEEIKNSDPSPVVRAAAKRFQEQIAESEKAYAKKVGRAR